MTNGSPSVLLDESVSNTPAEAAEPVEERIVVEPSTQGREAVTGDNGAIPELAPLQGAGAARETWRLPVPEEPLADIGEASFGIPSLLEALIGDDERVQRRDTDAYPWRAIASLRITAADNSSWIGTAWFVSPRLLITAGHCVYIKNSGVPGRDGWVKKIAVMPGRNGAALPYGLVTSTEFRSSKGWIENGDQTYDYGAIILPVPLGETTGVFGLGVYPDAELLATEVSISGYPGDKAEGTQWSDQRQIAQVSARKVFYAADTAGGQSGAPVFRIINGQHIGVAVHAYGGTTTNSGTRINPDVHRTMIGWMNDLSGTRT